MATNAQRISALEHDVTDIKSGIADILALVSAPAKSAPARGKAKSTARTFATKAEMESGHGFPCTADGGCGRFLRTAKRARVHGVDDGGHNAA